MFVFNLYHSSMQFGKFLLVLGIFGFSLITKITVCVDTLAILIHLSINNIHLLI